MPTCCDAAVLVAAAQRPDLNLFTVLIAATLGALAVWLFVMSFDADGD